MKRLVLLAACTGAQSAPQRPEAPGAPLSVAADDRMLGVPAGRYIAGSTPEERMGGDDLATAREADRHVATLPTFRIDLMPVTQAQYAELVVAEHVPPPPSWQGDRPPAQREDHPIVMITLAEAQHYCSWRGALRNTVRRLPSADEFEKAARGDTGMAYPWGNAFAADKLDSAVDGPGDTMPVGSFLAGASPYGVLDMAGNVEQWTSTTRDGAAVVKGSSYEDRDGGRGAAWRPEAPAARKPTLGFRCAAAAESAR